MKTKQTKQTIETTLQVLSKHYNTVELIQKVGGLSNDNYLVKLDGAKYVVRVPGQAMEELELSTLLSESLNAAKFVKTSDNFVGIRVIDGIKVQKYIENAFTYENEDVSSNISKIAQVLSKMHTNTEILATHFNMNATLNRYTTSLFIRSHAFVDMLHTFSDVINVARCADQYLKTSGAKRVASHNDALANNWVENEKTGKLYLIDYEYAGQNYFCFDLASVSVESKLSVEDECKLINEYCFSQSHNVKLLNLDTIVKQVAVCKFYQDVLWAIWGYVKAYSTSGELLDRSMLDYADARLTNAMQSIEHVKLIVNN